MKLKKRLGILLAAILLFAGAAAVLGHADFGDYGGDSDYGDYGGFDSYDSYDSNDSYDYGNDYDNDSDSDFGNGFYFGGLGGLGGSGGSSSGGDGAAMIGAVFTILLIVVLIAVLRAKRKKRQTQKPAGAVATDPRTLRPVADYTAVDPQFSAPEFSEKLSNLYVQFQNAWQAKDLEPLRPYLTDAFYAQMDRQLENYRRSRQTNRVERIAVLGVELMGWKQESGRDLMVAQLRARIVDYVVDDQSGKVVRGSETAEKFMRYEWTLERTTGVTTAGSTGTTVNYCPNCGAPIDLNHSAKCPYCDSILTTDTFDWAVSGIKGLAQQTGA